MMIVNQQGSEAKYEDFAKLEEESFAGEASAAYSFRRELRQEIGNVSATRTKKKVKRLKSMKTSRLPSLKIVTRIEGDDAGFVSSSASDADVSYQVSTKTRSSITTKQTLKVDLGVSVPVLRTKHENAKFASSSGKIRASTASTGRQVKRLTKVASLRTRRSSMDKSSKLVDFHANRATCSSAIKASKVSERHDLERGVISRKASAKLCPYSYCSLHGHHGSNLVPLHEHTPKSRHFQEPIFFNSEEDESQNDSMICKIENAAAKSVGNSKTEIIGNRKDKRSAISIKRREGHNDIPKLAIMSEEAREISSEDTVIKNDSYATEVSEISRCDSASNISMATLPIDVHLVQASSVYDYHFDDLSDQKTDEFVDSTPPNTSKSSDLAPTVEVCEDLFERNEENEDSMQRELNAHEILHGEGNTPSNLITHDKVLESRPGPNDSNFSSDLPSPNDKCKSGYSTREEEGDSVRGELFACEILQEGDNNSDLNSLDNVVESCPTDDIKLSSDLASSIETCEFDYFEREEELNTLAILQEDDNIVGSLQIDDNQSADFPPSFDNCKEDCLEREDDFLVHGELNTYEMMRDDKKSSSEVNAHDSIMESWPIEMSKSSAFDSLTEACENACSEREENDYIVQGELNVPGLVQGDGIISSNMSKSSDLDSLTESCENACSEREENDYRVQGELNIPGLVQGDDIISSDMHKHENVQDDPKNFSDLNKHDEDVESIASSQSSVVLPPTDKDEDAFSENDGEIDQMTQRELSTHEIVAHDDEQDYVAQEELNTYGYMAQGDENTFLKFYAQTELESRPIVNRLSSDSDPTVEERRDCISGRELNDHVLQEHGSRSIDIPIDGEVIEAALSTEDCGDDQSEIKVVNVYTVQGVVSKSSNFNDHVKVVDPRPVDSSDSSNFVGATDECEDDLSGREDENEDLMQGEVNTHETTKLEGKRLWHLIYQKMVLGLAREEEIQITACTNEEAGHTESTSVEDTILSTASQDGANQTISLYQSKAIKLVEEAFNKILFDIPDQAIGGEDADEGKLKDVVESGISEMSNTTEEKVVDVVLDSGSSGLNRHADESITKKRLVNSKDFKCWSRIKKIVLLKKFVKALEKVKNMRPHKSKALLLIPDHEAEKVNLRHLAMEDKRRSEEWMLDYALQKVISTLTPAKKKKVALIVQAFESVIPEIGTTESSSGRNSSTAPTVDRSSHLLDQDNVAKTLQSEILPLLENSVNEATAISETVGSSTNYSQEMGKESQRIVDAYFQRPSEVSSSEKSSVMPLGFPEETRKESEIGTQSFTQRGYVDDGSPGDYLYPDVGFDSPSVDSDGQKGTSSGDFCALSDSDSNSDFLFQEKNMSLPVETNDTSAMESHMKTKPQIHDPLSKGPKAVSSTGAKKKYASLWFIVYKHMVSGTATVLAEDDRETGDEQKAVTLFDSNSGNFDPQMNKETTMVCKTTLTGDDDLVQIEAIRMVEEAIDSIHFPENQDELLKTAMSEKENLTEILSHEEQVSIQMVNVRSEVAPASTNVESKTEIVELGGSSSTGNSGKRRKWKDIKKLIVLQRFMKAMEKVHKISHQQVVPAEHEEDMMKLKHQNLMNKKKDGEWMLDFALQKAILKLTPERKRKVQVLVEAFETVIPANQN